MDSFGQLKHHQLSWNIAALVYARDYMLVVQHLQNISERSRQKKHQGIKSRASDAQPYNQPVPLSGTE
jgi:hypothetical protein